MSIRWKLFSFTALLIGLFLLVTVIANAFFLQDYYVSLKKKQLLEAAQTLQRTLEDTPERIDYEIEMQMRMKGLHGVIFDLEKGEPVFYSGWNPLPRGERLVPPPSFRIEDYAADADPSARITSSFDPRANMETLSLVQPMGQGKVLELSIPIGAIHEEALIAGNYLLALALVMLVIGIPAAFLLSLKFTRPIQELTSLAKSISQLDFSRRYHETRNDEIGVLGMSINDLSDKLGQAMERLVMANQVLQEDLESKKRIDQMRKTFISHVSHELKTPITLIMGHAEGLARNVIHGESKKNQYCSIIIEEAQKMDQLVRELLDLSQMESRLFRIHPISFSLERLIRKGMDKFAPLFLEADIQVKDRTTDWPDVWGDPLRIEQVFTNLLTNAIHHTSDDRIIEVTTEKSKTEPGEPTVRVCIFNTGTPLPSEQIEHLFDGFTAENLPRGNGLGLSIVQGIMRAHNMAYGVTNRPDGVSFWFEVSLMPLE